MDLAPKAEHKLGLMLAHDLEKNGRGYDLRQDIEEHLATARQDALEGAQGTFEDVQVCRPAIDALVESADESAMLEALIRQHPSDGKAFLNRLVGYQQEAESFVQMCRLVADAHSKNSERCTA